MLPPCHRRTGTSLLVLALALGVAACGKSPTDQGSGADPEGPYSLETSLDFGSVSSGGTRTITVTALDLNTSDIHESIKVPFSAQSSGNCISISTAAETITVTGLSQPCTQDITITVGDQTKTVTMQTYDVLSLDLGDGLLMSYTDEFASSGSDYTNYTFYHPTTTKPDYYPIGSYANHYPTRPNGPHQQIPMIVLKDTSPNQDQLAFPTSYTKWNWVVLAPDPAQFYTPNCPTSPKKFVALGGLVWAYSAGAPPLDAMVCVAEDKVVPALIGPIAYHDNGTGGSIDISMWYPGAAIEGVTPDDRMALAPNTAVICGGNDNNLGCDTSQFYRLRIPVPAMSAGRNGSPVRLAGPDQLADDGEIFSGSVRIPFTALPTEDPFCEAVNGVRPCAPASGQAATLRVHGNVTLTPFYFIERAESYILQGGDQNTTGQPALITWKEDNCFERSTSEEFSKSFGVTVEAGGGVNFSFGSVESKVTISTQLGWTTTVASRYTSCTSKTREWTLPPGRGAGWAQVYSTWRARAETGAIVPGAMEAGQGVQTLVEWVVGS